MSEFLTELMQNTSAIVIAAVVIAVAFMIGRLFVKTLGRFAMSTTIKVLTTILSVIVVAIGGIYVAQNNPLTDAWREWRQTDEPSSKETEPTEIIDESSPDFIGPLATASHQQIKSELMTYTNERSAGPIQNYYWNAGQAKLVDDDDINNGDIRYSHDVLGRAGMARAKLTYQMYAESKGKRQGDPLDPARWPQNGEVSIHHSLTDRIYNGYMYNRSHSVADSLGGEITYSSEDNFTTGTRTQNVGADHKGGMRAAEITVENYWKEHPNTNEIVHYQVTPVFNDNEYVPRGTIIDIKSSDNELNTRIVVINTAEGFAIDYTSGQYKAK